MPAVSKVFFLFLILLPFISLHGQSLNSVNYSEKEGLASSTVYSIAQDKEGYLWFATENGLSRFDGKRFENLTTKNGLPDNSILQVHSAADGRIFFIPFTHTPYYYKNDSVYKFPIPEKYRNDVLTGAHFANTAAGLAYFAHGTSYFINGDRIVSLQDTFPVLAANSKLLWTYDSLLTILKGDSTFFISASGKIKREIFLKEKNFIYSRKGEILLLFPGKYLMNISGFVNSDRTIYFVYYNNTAHFYSTETGKLLYKIKIEKFSQAFIDSEGSLWIATLGNGVYRFLPFNFRQIKDENDGIYAFTYWNKKVYAGSDMSKLYAFDNNTEHKLDPIISLDPFLAFTGNPISQSSKRNRIFSLFPNANNLYIGTDAFLLKKRKDQHDLFSPIFPVKDIDISAGKMLLSTGKAVLLLDPKTLAIKDTLLKQRATCGVIYNRDYYLGTMGGLIKVDARNKNIIELYKVHPLLGKRIASIKKGINNDLWIASNGYGLIQLKDDRILKVISEKNGITSDICTSLFIDSTTVWLGTSKGLNRIENAAGSEVITRISSANGLPSNLINAIYVVDENVYIGSPTGITYFDKKTLLEKSICLLHIQNVLLNGNKLKKDNSYTFSHNALNIQINFAAISFKSAGDISYYYKLDGLDNDWKLTTDNYVNFATLPHGDYTFEIKAINKFGVASPTQSVDITILPAWWQTWLFKAIAALLSVTLITLLYRNRIASYKRKEEEKRKIEARYAELEQQALLAQMNPHFIFNCLNSIQSFVIAHDVVGANHYITAFSSLIRQTLENSSNTFISLQAEIRYLTTYLRLEQLRFKDKFTFSIMVEDSIEQSGVYLPSMLLQPYVENALRHGVGHRKDNLGHISVEVKKQTDKIFLYTIKDNGVGRKQAEQMKSRQHIEYQSKGTRISANRIASINNQYKKIISAEITDIAENGTAGGTCIRISIPNFIENHGYSFNN